MKTLVKEISFFLPDKETENKIREELERNTLYLWLHDYDIYVWSCLGDKHPIFSIQFYNSDMAEDERVYALLFPYLLSYGEIKFK